MRLVNVISPNLKLAFIESAKTFLSSDTSLNNSTLWVTISSGRLCERASISNGTLRFGLENCEIKTKSFCEMVAGVPGRPGQP